MKETKHKIPKKSPIKWNFLIFLFLTSISRLIFFLLLTSEGKIIFNTILTAFSHLEKKGKYLTLSRYYDEHTQNSIVSGKLLFFVLKL